MSMSLIEWMFERWSERADVRGMLAKLAQRRAEELASPEDDLELARR
jgi:hypothetical protein